MYRASLLHKTKQRLSCRLGSPPAPYKPRPKCVNNPCLCLMPSLAMREPVTSSAIHHFEDCIVCYCTQTGYRSCSLGCVRHTVLFESVSCKGGVGAGMILNRWMVVFDQGNAANRPRGIRGTCRSQPVTLDSFLDWEPGFQVGAVLSICVSYRCNINPCSQKQGANHPFLQILAASLDPPGFSCHVRIIVARRTPSIIPEASSGIVSAWR
ncbi:hypothetical protein M011DRAFT_338513 [Sporormia fimetaria CBS 119925]|uniref:Uncharacterized protein n=1 Tax=Sporormia fimetaria CBS 119925 TaxID=1340428 RepID=A0A6A6VE28_9PLEO|nr:hypothetical protein M011DRAFT_338513 [Sporormia fimetaria CBS 119925]